MQSKPSVIRVAATHELTKLAEIYWTAWKFAFSRHLSPENLVCVTVGDFEDRWRGFFRKEAIHSFVYERDGVPVGFVTCDAKKDGPAEIVSLMVVPASIRAGIGRKLMERALSFLDESRCSPASLWVVKENTNARRFYERFGFSLTGDKRFIQRYGVELCQLRYEKQL